MTPLSRRIARHIDSEMPLIPASRKIKPGYCHCGCDQPAPIAKWEDKRRGWVKGSPVKFCYGHNRRKRLPLEEAVPFKIDGVYCRLLPLTQGLYAIVRVADYESAMMIKWIASKNTNGYYVWCGYKRSNGKVVKVSLHEFIHGRVEGKTIDHRNGCGLDNRLGNLRPASPEQQGQNKRKPGLIKKSRLTSIYKGVSKTRGESRFCSSIKYKGKLYRLGRSDEEIEAARLYDIAAIKFFGEFAVLNFPRSDYGV